MSKRVHDFMDDFERPTTFIDPLHGPGLSTMSGEGTYDYSLRMAFEDAIEDRGADEEIDYVDTTKPVSTGWLLDRYEDATGGISPGKPWILTRRQDPETTADQTLGIGMNQVMARLQRFQSGTNVRLPSMLQGEEIRVGGDWAGSAYKFQRKVEMPAQHPTAQALLHELGHCTMGLVGLGPESKTRFDGTDLNEHGVDRNYSPVTIGIEHIVGDENRGVILEEGIADALGALVAKRTGIIRPARQPRDVPEEIQHYFANGNHSHSAPAAVALELIAKEIGLPFDRYLRQLVDYANAGTDNMDARQEVAESIYNGTRQQLTMAQVEGLPYPITRDASLALLWAVESAQDIPDHSRYSQFFTDYSA